MTAQLIFLVGAAILFYVVAGYPLLLGWMAGRWGRPVRTQAIEPHLSILVPVYNGEVYLAAKLDSILRADYPREKVEIWVASDGSTDTTADIARAYADQGVHLVELPRGGKPAALNAVIPQLHGEIVVLTDVRQVLAPDSLRHLVTAFADPEVGVVSGELRIRAGQNQAEAAIGLYWRLETWIRDQLSTLDSMFGATGPFYAIRRELTTPVPAEVLLDDMYLPLHSFFRGYRLVMQPLAKAYDYPTSRETEFNRKVRTLAGNYQLLRYYPQLLGSGNRMWFHYVSYKVGRLLLPWTLAVVLVTSFFLDEPARTVALRVQTLFYLAAFLDPWIPEQSASKRLTSPICTFVTMMAAAVAGLSVFFVPPQRLWKVTGASNAKPSNQR